MVVVDERKSGIVEKVKNSAFLKKLKTIKHIEVIFAIIIVAIIALCLTVPVGGNKEISVDERTEADYLEYIEAKLKSVLLNIKGVSSVEVMITYDGTIENVLANSKTYSSDKTVDSSSSSSRTTESDNKTESPVIIEADGKDTALIIKRILPEIKGVIVVAEGAESVKVRMDLLRAVQTVLDITADKVEIFEKNS